MLTANDGDRPEPGGFRLTPGPHAGSHEGMCAMELAAWVAGERHTDRPRGACPVITRMVHRLNDDLPDEGRQWLIGYARALAHSAAGYRAVERRVALARAWLADELPRFEATEGAPAAHGAVAAAAEWGGPNHLWGPGPPPPRLAAAALGLLRPAAPAPPPQALHASLMALLDRMLAVRDQGPVTPPRPRSRATPRALRGGGSPR